MKQLLNTLYVMTQGAYVNLDHETLKVEVAWAGFDGGVSRAARGQACSHSD